MKIWNEKKNRYYEVIPPQERFVKYFKKSDGCWKWTGGRDNDGYGIFTIQHGHCTHASRYSWIFHRGEVPKGMFVLHRCDVRDCVNPDHLFLGTAKENTHDMINKGRQCVGTDHPRSKLSEADVKKIRELYVPIRGSMARLAKAFNVNHSLIKRIIQHKVWKHI